MLDGIEQIFSGRTEMMTSLKKESYETFTRRFDAEYGHYFSEMREYTERAEDKEAAADEIGARVAGAVEAACAGKKGKLDARSRSELSLFLVYYVFPAILKQGELGTVIADGVLKACRKVLKNRGMKYVDYDTIYHGFREKILGLF